MSQAFSDRNLLIGVLSLQMDFISRDQLIDALSKWILDKSIPLDDILVESEALDETSRDLILPLVERHIEIHQGDPQQSLASLSWGGHSLKEVLDSLTDPALEISITAVGTQNTTGGTQSTVGSLKREDLRNRESRFHILRPHAKGGLGQVSIAFDSELNREVALKEIQDRHADRSESRSRFILEAEITGGLEHPGIVPVYGLGTYTNGRPFYAMRFVRGDSLRDAADEIHEAQASSSQMYRCLDYRRLLKRFVDVCNTVQYAHSRGVIHRDLKPGNVMLGKYGETLVVDWGLAKAIGRPENLQGFEESTLQVKNEGSTFRTQLGSAIGTPTYMSPEQAAGNITELQPTTDIYSLGATLYYLLTGKVPFDGTNVNQVLTAVKKGDLKKPRDVASHVPKPLEAICQKAMSVNPDDRYQSPAELGDEVDRWLADQPVQSYATPVIERCRRWIRQHQSAAATAASFLVFALVSSVVLLGVISDSNWKLQRLNQQLDVRNVELGDAYDLEKDAREEAERFASELQLANEEIVIKEQEVRQERDIAVAISDFIRNDILGQASPDEEPDRNIMLRTVLDRAAMNVGRRFERQPLVEAAVAQTIGDTYNDLGLIDKAESFIDRAYRIRLEHLGEEHQQTLRSMNNLAVVYGRQSLIEEAESLHNEMLEISRRVLGDAHPYTISGMHNLASLYQKLYRFEESEQLFEQTLEIKRELHGEGHQETFMSVNNLAALLRSQGRLTEAEQLLQPVFDSARETLGDEDPNAMGIMSTMAMIYRDQNRFEQAKQLYETNHDSMSRILGNEHPDTLMLLNNLGSLYQQMRRFDDAEQLFEEVKSIRERTLGQEHPHTLSSMHSIAFLYEATDRVEEARDIYETTLIARQRVLGDDHSATITTKHNLAGVYRILGQLEQAESTLLQTLEQSERVLGDFHPTTLSVLNNLGALYWRREQYDQSIPLLERCLQRRQELYGEEYASSRLTQANLGVNYLAASRVAEAIFHLEQVKDHAFENTQYDWMIRSLLEAYEENDQPDQAVTVIDEWMQQRREAYSDSAIRLASQLARSAIYYLRFEAWQEAEDVLRECVSIRTERIPDSWTRFHAMSMLGEALANRDRLNEAGDLLEQGYDGMKERVDSIPEPSRQFLLGAIDRLMTTSERQGDIQTALQWREERFQVQTQLGYEYPFSPHESGARPPRPQGPN